MARRSGALLPMNTPLAQLSARAPSSATGFSFGGSNHSLSVVLGEEIHRDSRDGERQILEGGA